MRILIRDRQRRRRINKIRISRHCRRILTLLNRPGAELSILFTGDREMSRLNAQYRGIEKSTDVLSFPQNSGLRLQASGSVLGDVVICVPKAELQAEAHGLGFYDEVRRLLVHGILHLLGYDHEKSAYYERQMKRKEQELFHATQEMD